MFATQETTEVKLLCENGIMKAIIDKFGLKIRTKAIDADHFQATVKVCTSPTFYRWVFGWGGMIKIGGPEEVIAEYKNMLEAEQKIVMWALPENNSI